MSVAGHGWEAAATSTFQDTDSSDDDNLIGNSDDESHSEGDRGIPLKIRFKRRWQRAQKTLRRHVPKAEAATATPCTTLPDCETGGKSWWTKFLDLLAKPRSVTLDRSLQSGSRLAASLSSLHPPGILAFQSKA